MEVEGIIDVFHLCWISLLLKSSEIIFGELGVILSDELVLWRMLNSPLVFVINSLTSCLGEALAVKVLTSYLRYVTGVPWDMLGFDVAVWSSNPVGALV